MLTERGTVRCRARYVQIVIGAVVIVDVVAVVIQILWIAVVIYGLSHRITIIISAVFCFGSALSINQKWKFKL